MAGPWVGGWLFDAKGSCNHAILVNAGWVLAGMLAAIFLMMPVRTPQLAPIWQ